jgi:hypothetical protein
MFDESNILDFQSIYLKDIILLEPLPNPNLILYETFTSYMEMAHSLQFLW